MKPDVLDKIDAWAVVQTQKIKSKLRGARKRWALSHLEKTIAGALEIVEGHKRNGVAAGSEVYQTIWSILNGQIDQFCLESGIAREYIESQVPGLQRIKSMLEPEQPAVGKIIGLTVGSVIAAMAIVGTMATLYALFRTVANFWLR
jgi:hypothetical protein